MKILIADDNHDDRNLLRAIVEKHGHEVIEAADGREGLNLAASCRPDLIISDALMPVLDGFKFLKAIKDDDRLKRIPFIFYSATYTEEKDFALALSLGAEAYIVKPKEPNALWLEIESKFLRKENASAAGTKLRPGDAEYLERYSEVVAAKLEKKVEELEEVIQQRRKIEEQVRFMASIIENVPEAICSIDLSGAINFWNREAQELFGYDIEEITGRPFLAILPDNENIQRMERYLETVAESGFVRQVEIMMITKAGRKVPIGLTLFAMRDKEDAVTCYTAIMRDIREQKKAARKIEEQQQFLQNSIDALTHPFYVIDVDDYTIVLANKASNYGLGSCGETCYSITHSQTQPCSGEKHPCPLKQIVECKQPVIVEHQHIDNQGVPIDVEIHAYPIFDKLGNVKQIIEYCLDVSERKQRETERKRLFAAIEQGADSIIITDAKGVIQYVNPSFCRISGYSRKEAVGSTPRILKSGLHDAAFYTVMWETISRGRVWRGQLINKNKAGKLYKEEASITPVTNEAGEIVNYVAVKRDVTAQSKLEDQLLQAQKMETVGNLAGGIAHDFNNILTPILGYSELALDAVPDDSQAEAMIQEVLKGAKRAKELVQQILTFSRRAEQNLRPLMIQKILTEALKLLRASIPATIEMRTEIDPACRPVLADMTQIHQVIMNLCTNAYHAMREEGGLLEITLQGVEFSKGDRLLQNGLAPGRYVMLKVRDTGHGITKKSMGKIFEPYYTTKEQGEGTGLGLSIVHGIVKSLRGEITVESEIGKGTVFRIFFPEIAEQEGQEQWQGAREPLPGGKERILVLDDEPVITAMQEQLLCSLGYRVTTFTSATEAWDMLRHQPESFDLLITDMTMPKMTGVELAQSYLAVRPDARIILCTGFSELINEEKAKSLGIREFLMKPVVKSDLAKAVRRALDE